MPANNSSSARERPHRSQRQSSGEANAKEKKPSSGKADSGSDKRRSGKDGLIIANKYKLGRKLGSGSFGDIYHGTHLQTGEEVAVKLEKAKTKHPQLHYETKLYRLIQGVGIPRVHCSGTEGDFNVMVMDLLGHSLEDLFNMCNRKFSLKTALVLADQMLVRVELLHSKSFVHRDIKPDNFLIGTGKKRNLVNMIDFGLAKMYRDLKTHKHISYKGNKLLTGTARYASVNTHLGIEQGRRDDIESLGYVLMYFLRGSLPWQGLHATNKKHKYDLISEKKMSTPVEVLCQGFPQEFTIYLNYARSLRFDDEPDYAYLRKLFQELFKRKGFTFDMVFDWNQIESKKRDKETERSDRHAPAPPENSGARPERRRPEQPEPERTEKRGNNSRSDSRRDPSPMIKISATTREGIREVGRESALVSDRRQSSRAHMHSSQHQEAAVDPQRERRQATHKSDSQRQQTKNAASLHADSSNNVRESTRRTAATAIRQQNSGQTAGQTSDGHNMLLPVRSSMYNGKKSVSSHRSRQQESGSLSSRRKTQSNQNADAHGRVASLKPVALPRRPPSRDAYHRNAEVENGQGQSRSSMPSVRSKKSGQ